MVTTNNMLQAFFYAQNPVDAIQAWMDYIGGPVPVADSTAPKWKDLTNIAQALVDADVAELLLGIGVESSDPVTVHRSTYDRSYDPDGKNCVFGSYQEPNID